MATYFLDTSALVKRHIAEPGRAWIQALCAPVAGNTIVIAEVAIVEVASTFSRMARERPQRITDMTRDQLIKRFNDHVQRDYSVVEVNRAIFTQAADLCRRRPLRAYDAVQLACALTRRDDDVAANQPAPIFVCADAMLLKVASAEGLATENPNDHL